MFATTTLSMLRLFWQTPLHLMATLLMVFWSGWLTWWWLRQMRLRLRQSLELKTHLDKAQHVLTQRELPQTAAAWPAFLREHKLYELAHALESSTPPPMLETYLERWLQRLAALERPPKPGAPPLSAGVLTTAGMCIACLSLWLSPDLPPAAALWPLFCALVPACLGMLLDQHVRSLYQRVELAYREASRELGRWLDHKLLPHLPPTRRPRAGVQALENLQQTLQRVMTQQTQFSVRGQEQWLQALQDSQAPLQEPLAQISKDLRSLTEMPQNLQALAQPLDRVDQSLNRWSTTLEEMEGKLQHFSRTLGEGLEPIAHSERLLSERIAALSRHYVALSDMLERIEQHERQLPQRTAELLKLSLRPAHQLLQRTSLSLVKLLEEALNQQTREREGWRRLMGELNERLNSFDRLTHTHEKLIHELSGIADTLTELSTQIRFRPIIPTMNQEEPQNINEALETEIEQLLDEGFQDLQRPATSSEPS